MKEVIALALALALLLVPLIGLSEGYVSIEVIGKQSLERWTQSYETNWRTIEVDVQPRLPDVEKIPILKVSPDLSIPNVSILGDEWEYSVDVVGGIHISNDKGEASAYLSRIEKEENGKTVSSHFYAPYDTNRIYAENLDVSLGQVLDELDEYLASMGLSSSEWDFSQPEDVLCNKLIDETGEFLSPGMYYIMLNQSLNGIPLYNRSCSREQEMSWDLILLFTRYTSEAMSTVWRKVKIKDVLAEDVPLCDFSIIKDAIETEINAGHIRKIFDVELGYTLFNEPGSEYGVPRDKSKLPEAIYYAVPVWRVNCYYVESEKKELRDYSGLDVPERTVSEYYSIMFDAQTGSMLNQFNTRKGDGEYKGFISWEDIGEKE